MSIQEEQTMLAISKREVTSIGFWLPIGRANFFHAKHDQSLLKNANNLNKLNFEIESLSDSIHNEETPLNTSVYRRMVSIAQAHGYAFAIPYYPSFRLDYLDVVEDTDPDSLLLVSHEYPLVKKYNKNISTLFDKSVKAVPQDLL